MVSLVLNRGRSNKRAERRVRPRLEVLEDRCLLAEYVWSGAANGFWSAPANWTPNGVPGAADTATFNNTNNADSVMDLQNVVGKVQISGYTGTIKLQRMLDIDVLVMSSGMIVRDANWQGGAAAATLFVSQIQANVGGPSSWTGGTIGNSADFKLSILGSQQNPITFNIGAPNGTVEFGGTKWTIGESQSGATVNWVQGDIKMADVGLPFGGAGELVNEGTFQASSGGQIYTPAGKRWQFTNGALEPGKLVLKDRNKQFIRCTFQRAGGQVIQQPNLDGSPLSFLLDGEALLNGGTLQIQSGTFQVTENVTQDGGSITLSPGTTLKVDGNLTQVNGVSSSTANASHVLVTGYFQQDGGTTQIGSSSGSNSLLQAASIAVNGGTLILFGSTLSASGGVAINSGGTLAVHYGPSTLTGNLTNNGTVRLYDVAQVVVTRLNVSGNYTQANNATLDVGIKDQINSLLAVSGVATLDGTLKVTVCGNPPYGGYWDVITWGSRIGAFNTVILPPGNWWITYEAGKLRVWKTP